MANKGVRKKSAQLRTDGATSIRASVGALWGPKQLESLVDLHLSFQVVPEKVVLRRREEGDVLNLVYFFLLHRVSCLSCSGQIRVKD